MKVSRFVLRGAAGGELRTARFEGKEYVVVPVVALVEGVVWASNADTPELVLAEEFGKVPASWDGRPAMLDHPELQGEKVSANSPRVLEALRIGHVFNARLDGDRLKVDAWLDPERCEEVGGEGARVLERCRAGETVEVSVGVFVDTEEKTGLRDGVRYAGVWRNVIPDHLAFLPEGKMGACSVEMGCGAPRAAAGGGAMLPPKQIQSPAAPPRTAAVPPEAPKEPAAAPASTGLFARLREKFDTLVAAVAARPDPLPKSTEAMITRAAELGVSWEATERMIRVAQGAEETSDVDLRMALEQALHASEPAFMSVIEVFPAERKVIYAVAPEGEVRIFRRSYELAEDGTARLGSDAEEGKYVQRFETITAASASGGSGAQPAANEPARKEADMKTKKERATAIVASGKTCFKGEAGIALLEKADEALLKHLEDSTAEEPAKEPEKKEPPAEPPATPPTPPPADGPLTEEKVLAAFPDLKKIVDGHRAAESKRHTDLVAKLKDAAKASYSEGELKAMSVEQLEKIEKLVAASASAKPRPDFTPLAPRAAGDEDGAIPHVPTMAERILARQEKKTA